MQSRVPRTEADWELWQRGKWPPKPPSLRQKRAAEAMSQLRDSAHVWRITADAAEARRESLYDAVLAAYDVGNSIAEIRKIIREETGHIIANDTINGILSRAGRHRNNRKRER